MRPSAVADTLEGLVSGCVRGDIKSGGLSSEKIKSRNRDHQGVFICEMVSLYRWASFDTVVAVGGDGGAMYCCLECAPTPASPRVEMDPDALRDSRSTVSHSIEPHRAPLAPPRYQKMLSGIETPSHVQTCTDKDGPVS